MSEFIEVEVVLDSHNLLQIEALINWRVKELKQLKKEHAEHPNGIVVASCNEQLLNYKQLAARIAKGREDVKDVKAKSDAAYFASRRKTRARA